MVQGSAHVLEQAVHREVFEGAGVQLSAMEYIASQPWPFPGSPTLQNCYVR